MYENITYEDILQRMLDKVPDDIDKREGSIIYDALAPAAIEMQNMYIELDNTLNETFPDTASREYLIKRCVERGITPKPATNAIVNCVYTPKDLIIELGTRFSLNNLNYEVVEIIQDGICELKCETSGVVGNDNFGSLIPIDYVEGLKSAQLTGVLIPGEDEEETETLRNRYFENVKSQSFGGNVSDYKDMVNSIQGVAGVKVYPTFNGPGTVKLVIISSEFDRPSDTLLEKVQNIIDPIDSHGMGVGLAPIGHTVTVEPVRVDPIQVESKITYQTNWTWDDIKDDYNRVLEDYYLELSKTWAEVDNIIVRKSQIELRLLDINGIKDIEIVSLNFERSNIELDPIAIPDNSKG